MTHTALLTLTVVCFVVAFVAELAGVALAASEVRSASRALRRWKSANPAATERGSDDHLLRLDPVISGLLGNSFDRVAAVALILVGIVTGALGNFLSLGL
jgi:hypothetical protein